jgi:hypothetical protein
MDRIRAEDISSDELDRSMQREVRHPRRECFGITGHDNGGALQGESVGIVRPRLEQPRAEEAGTTGDQDTRSAQFSFGIFERFEDLFEI